jgi:hypothetical protein
VLYFFGYIPRSGIAESYGRSMFRFFKMFPNLFPEWLHQLAFPPAVDYGSFFSTSSRTPLGGGAFDDCYSNRGEVES